MANGYYGDAAVKLPNMFQAPGQALASRIDDINRSNERQFEIDYRIGKEKEAEEWRKLNLIQELTNLDKYRTGNDVADAIGYNKMNEVYQRYTSSAGSMSPAELQGRIQKDMSGILTGMNAAKEELNLADEQLKMLKQKYPSLDIARIGSDYRAEILTRRIKNNDFENPLTVGPSQFDILNPDKLSGYVTGNTKLTEAIQNPKGAETMKVFKGSPSAYTEYAAKLNPWKKESFDRSKLEGGFMTTKGEPKLEIKASALPGAKTQDGQPFMVMDEDIYKKFSEDEALNLELTAATKNKFRNYDNLSPEEKSLAKRNTLYDKIKELDPSDYYPSDVKAAPRTYSRTNINLPGATLNINDLYSRIEAAVDEHEKTPSIRASGVFGSDKFYKATPVQGLPLDESNMIVEFVNKSYPNKGVGDNPYKAHELFLLKDKNGRIKVYDNNEAELGTLPRIGVNVKAQSGVKAKDKVIGMGETKNEIKGRPPLSSFDKTNK